MGITRVWIAVPRPAHELHVAFNATPSGVRSDLPEPPLWASQGSSGCQIIGADGWGHTERFLDDALLAKLSQGTHLVRYLVDEHSMQSHACEWSDGKILWMVRHDASEGLSHLDVQGELPPNFSQIRNAALNAQNKEALGANVDHLIEVARVLAETRVGFPPDAEDAFETLNDTPASSPMSGKGGSLIPIALISMLVGAATLVTSLITGRIGSTWPLVVLGLSVALVAISLKARRKR